VMLIGGFYSVTLVGIKEFVIYLHLSDVSRLHPGGR
jgi:hypothetical protein